MNTRNDPDLPFFYYTSNHDHFYEGERPSFDEKSKKKRSFKVSRAESMASSVFTSGKASLPSYKTLYTWAIFHNPPEELPPPPGIPAEHSYV